MNCCICEKEIKRNGNNAEPFRKGICCNECNMDFVIPYRMSDLVIMTNEKKKQIKEVRKATDVGMKEAKVALMKNKWDTIKAIEWINKIGLY